MDHAQEILTELRSLRTDVARLTALLEAEKDKGDRRERTVDSLEKRVRDIEQGQVQRLIGAGAGGGGLTMLIQWLINQVGG